MRSHFDEQLALLNRELIEMGGLCEEVPPVSTRRSGTSNPCA